MDQFEAIVRLQYLLSHGLYERKNVPQGRISTGQTIGGYNIYKPIAELDREALIKAISALERETRLRSAIQTVFLDEALNKSLRREVIDEAGLRDGNEVRLRDDLSPEDARKTDSMP